MSDNAIEIVARWIEQGGPGVDLESTRKLMAATVRSLSHPATQAGAVQAPGEAESRLVKALDNLAFMERMHTQFCVTERLGSARREVDEARRALAATQPNAAPGKDDARALMSDLKDWLEGLVEANFNGHVPQGVFSEANEYIERIDAFAAPGDGPGAAAVEDKLRAIEHFAAFIQRTLDSEDFTAAKVPGLKDGLLYSACERAIFIQNTVKELRTALAAPSTAPGENAPRGEPS